MRYFGISLCMTSVFPLRTFYVIKTQTRTPAYCEYMGECVMQSLYESILVWSIGYKWLNFGKGVSQLNVP